MDFFPLSMIHVFLFPRVVRYVITNHLISRGVFMVNVSNTKITTSPDLFLPFPSLTNQIFTFYHFMTFTTDLLLKHPKSYKVTFPSLTLTFVPY